MEQQDTAGAGRGTTQPSRDAARPSTPAAASPGQHTAGPWAAQAGHHHQQQQLHPYPQPAAIAGGAGGGGGITTPTGGILPAIPSDPSAKEQQQAAKQSLKQWWTKFTKQQQQQQSGYSGGSSTSSSSWKKEETSPTSSGVFGVPLTESLKYAGVAISMVGPDGINQVYGYIPIVVAKCGLFLKQKATTVEGVFRISGSTRRMKELQDIFDRPPSYGRDVVWGPWSVHDAASVLRRYLNQMPEPVIPYELYDEFRNALPPIDKVKDPAAINASILRYKALIACLPSSSKYLLCYVLDLLNVFHRHHAQNLMPAANLAVVFQPGLIRPPDTPFPQPGGPLPGASQSGGQSSEEVLNPPTFPHLSRTSSNPLSSRPMTASSSTNDSKTNTTELQRRQDEIKINQEVLEFLINHQDHFVALPEMLSSSEVSPVSPTSGSGGSGQSRGSHPAQPAVHHADAGQSKAPRTGPPQAAPRSRPTTSQGESVRLAQPLPPSQASSAAASPALPTQRQAQQLARPVDPTPHAHPQAPSYAHAPTQVQSRPQPPPIPAKAPSRTSSPAPFRGQEAQPYTGRSSPLQQTQQVRSPQSQPVAPMPLQAERSSPVQVLGQQQATTRAPKTSKDAEKHKDKEDRKPRKLKKGRTPTSSGTNTPLSPPIVAWDPASPLPPAQYHQAGPYHSSSSPPARVYDEDTPLSQQGMAGAGPGVKRSRTLPSPGEKEKGSLTRVVSGRRGSDSRAAPPSTTTEGRLGLEGRPINVPSPLRSPIPRGAPSPGLSYRHGGHSPVEQDQSEGSDAQAGPSDKKKNAGWGRAFRKDKDKEHSLLAPTSAGLQVSHSASSSQSAEDKARKGSMQQDTMSIQTQNRRPSSSSAARTEYSDASGQTQLRAVRNPPLHGQGKEGSGSMSKRDIKKAAEKAPEFSVEAIRDAVTNIGR